MADDIFPPETRATFDRLNETMETARREHEAERRANMTLTEVQEEEARKERAERMKALFKSDPKAARLNCEGPLQGHGQVGANGR